MKRFTKKVATICVLSLLFQSMASVPIGRADGRLTEFTASLSRIKRSGEGAATAGYVESNFAVSYTHLTLPTKRIV